MSPQGAPGLGLLALIWPGLASRCRFHPFAQHLRAASGHERSLAVHSDPYAFQGIEQDAPPGEPDPELAGLVSRLSINVVWHGIPLAC